MKVTEPTPGLNRGVCLIGATFFCFLCLMDGVTLARSAASGKVVPTRVSRARTVFLGSRAPGGFHEEVDARSEPQRFNELMAQTGFHAAFVAALAAVLFGFARKLDS